MRFNELRETLQLRLSGEFKRFADEELRAVLTLLAGAGGRLGPGTSRIAKDRMRAPPAFEAGLDFTKLPPGSHFARSIGGRFAPSGLSGHARSENEAGRKGTVPLLSGRNLANRA